MGCNNSTISKRDFEIIPHKPTACPPKNTFTSDSCCLSISGPKEGKVGVCDLSLESISESSDESDFEFKIGPGHKILHSLVAGNHSNLTHPTISQLKVLKDHF